MQNKHYDCLIVGAGPAGLSAALYAKRAGLNCAIVDKSGLGGAPTNYLEIENYLGFSKIQGFELCEKFEQHIDNFEIQKFPFEEIQKIDLVSDIKTIETLENKFFAKSIIIAMGAENKKLGIKGEIENIGKGVSYCAVCDGAFYKDKTVSVIGGGNSALEEAIYLTRFAKKVYLIHRRDSFRADKIVQEKLKDNKKIKILYDTVPIEVIATTRVEGLKVKNLKTNEIQDIKLDGIFPYIGLKPNTDMFLNQLELDEFGFIKTNCNMETSAKGVYAAGDIRNTPLRQVITAVSDGAVAAISASKYLEKEEKEEKRGTYRSESISL